MCDKLHFGMGLLSISEFTPTSMHFLLFLFLIHTCSILVRNQSVSNWTASQGKSTHSCTDVTYSYKMRDVLMKVFSMQRVMFGLISGIVFLSFTGLFCYLYGWHFLHEALLYHLTRTDPRQLFLQLVFIFCFVQDSLFCLFVQTVAFVAFNKVITVLYFVWFFCLLPQILQWSNMKLKWVGVCCIFVWMGAQTHWLMWGYMLEFRGKNVFLQLWMASLVFLLANTFILITIIRLSPLFLVASFKNAAKLSKT